MEDVFRFGIWNGSFDMGIGSSKQTSRLPDSTESTFSSRTTNEGVTIRNQGFTVIDSRLLSGNASLRFGLDKNQQSAGEFKSAQEGHLTDYSVDATLLAAKAYNANFYSNRSQVSTTLLAGGDSHTETESRGMTLRMTEDNILREMDILSYFNATLQARQEHVQDVTTMANQSFRRDEKRSIVNLDGHDGTETSDLYFRFENTKLDNLQFPMGSYQSHTADIGYSLDFGSDLSRTWVNRINYSLRNGDTSISNLNIAETLSIEHTDYLSTGYNYQYSQIKVRDDIVTAQGAGMQAQYRPYSNLSSNIGLNATQQTLAQGQMASKGAQASLSYDNYLPWSGQISSSLSGSVQINENHLQSALITVIDSPFVVPQQLGAGAGFLLKDSFIQSETIVVVNVKNGARLPTISGLDYLVVAEGNRTRILPAPTSAVILPGDLLEVSYLFLVDPSSRTKTTSHSISLEANWDWINFSLSRDVSLQKNLANSDDNFLSNMRRDTAKVKLHQGWDNLLASGDGTLVHYNDSHLVYDEWRLTQQLNYLGDNWTMGMNLNQSHTDFKLTQRQSDQRDSRLQFDWLSENGWWMNSYLSRRILRDTQLPSESVTEAAIKIRRKWSKLDLNAAFALSERVRSGMHSINANAQVAVVRHF